MAFNDPPLTPLAKHQAKQKWKKYIFYGAVAVGVIGIGGLGIYYFFHHNKEDTDKSDGKSDDTSDHEKSDDHKLDDYDIEASDEHDSYRARIDDDVKTLDNSIDDKTEEKKEEKAPTLQRIPSEQRFKRQMKKDVLPDNEKIVYTKQLQKYRKLKKDIAELPYWHYRNGVLKVTIIKTLNLNQIQQKDVNEIYVRLEMGKKYRKTSSKPISQAIEMEWNESFEFYVNDAVRDILLVKVYYNAKAIWGSKDRELCKFGVPVTDVIVEDGHSQNCEFFLAGSQHPAKIKLDFVYEEC